MRAMCVAWRAVPDPTNLRTLRAIALETGSQASAYTQTAIASGQPIGGTSTPYTEIRGPTTWVPSEVKNRLAAGNGLDQNQRGFRVT